MGALDGQIIMTLTDGSGQPYIVATWFWDPATGVLRDGTYVTSRGSRTGALIVDNLTGKPQAVAIADSVGTISRTVNVPANGYAATAAQLAKLNPPVTTAAQLNGLTFSLS